MRVWDGLSSKARICFDSPTPEPAIAQMIENQNLTRALLARLDSLEPISLLDKTSVREIHLGPSTSPITPEPASLNLSSYPHITLSSKNTIAARILIGADGPNSAVRTFAGIQTRGYDYNRNGVVATLKLPSSSAHDPSSPRGVTAFQRFLPSGPIALLALPGPYASLVWTTTPAQSSLLKTLSEEDFTAMVNAAFRLSVVDLNYMFTLPSNQLSEFQWRDSVYPSTAAEQNGDIPPLVSSVESGSVASFPLRLRHASSYTTHRIALIGDAAHTIHPLAGQGLNMGLNDSKALAQAIEYAVAHGADIGDEMGCLDGYKGSVWWGNQRLLGAVDKLHWLYSVGGEPVVGLRGWGLRAVDKMGELGVKGWLMRQAGVL